MSRRPQPRALEAAAQARVVRVFCLLALFFLITVATPLRGEVWDDFSGAGPNPAWRAPEPLVVTGVAGSISFDGTTYPGELAIQPTVPVGSQNFFYIQRDDHELKIGEVLRLKLRLIGVPQGTPGQDWVSIGLMLHPAMNRSQYLLFYAMNDTRVIGSSGDSQALISTWKVNQPLELFVQRTGLAGFRTGLRANNGALVEMFPPWTLSYTEPPIGSGVSLFINWDERSGSAAGKIILDELGTVPNPGFPEVTLPESLVAPRFGFPGDLIYFDGTHTYWNITAYEWKFPNASGPRTITNEAVGAQIFDTTGTYPVKLKLTFADQTTSTLVTTATILNPPQNAIPMPMRGYMTGGGNDVNTFSNPQQWETTLTWMQQIGLNTAISIQQHPFPYFTRVPGFPEANSDVSDGLLNNRRLTFENILQRARNHGIKLYLLTYNIFLPQTFATAHGLPTSGSSFSTDGVDTALTRAYTKAAAKAFFKAFPDVGLCMTVGESPVGCVDFVRETIVAAMLETTGTMPRLILRDQAIYPDDVHTLTDALPKGSWVMMSKLTEEQCLPEDGFRGRLFTQSLGERNFYLQSRTSDMMFIGSWQFAQRLCQAMARDHALGLLIASDPDIEWILREGVARYMQDPYRAPEGEASYWANRLRQKYGANTPAEAFLRAGEASSSVMPLVRSQLFYRNNNYKCQFGLPLISFAGMTSFPGFQHGGIIWPERESLFSWWYPRHARHPFDALTVQEFVNGGYQSRAAQVETPLSTADQLDAYAAIARNELTTLSAYTATANVTEYRNSVKLIQFAALMGEFYSAKLRAAVAWRRWASGKLTREAAASEIPTRLMQSLNCYLQASSIYTGIFGATAPGTFLMAAQSKQPPWSSDQNFHGTVTGGMPELCRIWQTELKEMQRRLEANDKTLPYFTDLQTMSPGTYQNDAKMWSNLE